MSDDETKTICGTCGTPIFIVEETEEDGVVWAHEQVIRCDDPDPRPVHSVVEVRPVDPRRRNPGVRNPGLLLAAARQDAERSARGRGEGV